MSLPKVHYRVMRDANGYHAEYKTWWPFWEKVPGQYRKTKTEATQDCVAHYLNRFPETVKEFDLP